MTLQVYHERVGLSKVATGSPLAGESALWLRGSCESLAVDVAPVADLQDEKASAFPLKDDSVVADAIPKPRTGRAGQARRKGERIGSVQELLDLVQDAALDVGRKFQKLRFGVFGERVGNQERRALRLTALAETRPDFRAASSDERNLGFWASSSSMARSSRSSR